MIDYKTKRKRVRIHLPMPISQKAAERAKRARPYWTSPSSAAKNPVIGTNAVVAEHVDSITVR